MQRPLGTFSAGYWAALSKGELFLDVRVEIPSIGRQPSKVWRAQVTRDDLAEICIGALLYGFFVVLGVLPDPVSIL